MAGGVGERDNVAGARDADVEETALLCLSLAWGVQFAEARRGGFFSMVRGGREVPLFQSWQIDNREFQTLACMQRQDMDCIFSRRWDWYQRIGSPQRIQIM